MIIKANLFAVFVVPSATEWQQMLTRWHMPRPIHRESSADGVRREERRRTGKKCRRFEISNCEKYGYSIGKRLCWVDIAGGNGIVAVVDVHRGWTAYAKQRAGHGETRSSATFADDPDSCRRAQIPLARISNRSNGRCESVSVSVCSTPSTALRFACK